MPPPASLKPWTPHTQPSGPCRWRLVPGRSNLGAVAVKVSQPQIALHGLVEKLEETVIYSPGVSCRLVKHRQLPSPSTLSSAFLPEPHRITHVFTSPAGS